MLSLDEKDVPAKEGPASKIQLLIIGRLMVIFVLLITTWFWNSGHLKLSIEDYPQGLLLVFLISVGLTIVYFFGLRLNKNYDWQVRVQFILDTLLITWLIWRTGDITSPYITLYTVLIAVSSIYLNPRGTLSFALLCFASFTTLAIMIAASVVVSFSEPPTTQTTTLLKTIQIVAFHDVAFLVVGLLAARLSARQASSGDRLRETEQSLINLRVLHERIVESIRSGLITTDLEGHIYTFNASAEEITRHKAKEMIGRSIFSLLGNIENSILPSLERTETGEQPLRFQTDILTPEGFIVHIGYGISPLFAENGKTTGLIITFQDLTEIRSMEESIRRKDRLSAVGRVAAGLAHEIRNPLGAMRGAIQVLQAQTPPDTSQSSLMEIILRESDRLNKIITNFLTYARPRVNNFLDTDVRESLGDTFTLLRHSPDIKETHVLDCELPETPIIISADQTQLKQIFWNLARNSVQAMPNGGKLSVRLERLPNKRIRIIFSDTGCGMPPAQVEQLFEPFSTSTTGGTGLGLSIVYQIVRDHGGTINVRSRENAGTTITVELPTDFRAPNAINGSDGTSDEVPQSRIEEFFKIREK